MTAAAQTGYRPPCAPWASRTDIEAAVALGVPLDLSYVERALSFRGFREVRIVGTDGYDERRLLVAPLNRDWEAAGDPVDWLMDEYDWLKRCKDAEVLAVSLAGLRGRK